MHVCYDRLVHNYGSMSWQTFGVLLCVAICMLMAIKLMELFLQTVHRDSTTMYGGQRDKEDPFQGLCQGKGAIPEGWVGVGYMKL